MNNTAMDYTRRFSGIRRLYGETALQCFADSHVCVIGVGGVGSWAAEALARSAIGEITLIDLDNVSESNVNRQIHALNDEFGRPKGEVRRQRILAINPACRVKNASPAAITPTTSQPPLPSSPAARSSATIAPTVNARKTGSERIQWL